MRSTTLLFSISALVLFACGDAGSSDDGATSGGGSATTSTGSAQGGNAGTGGSAPTLPTCHLTCSVPADCGQPSPAFDGSHWDCNEGECEYLGCNTTEECQETFQNGAYVCGAIAGTSVPTCHLECSAAADCGQPSPAFDASHYDCVDNACVYLGCNDASECQATFQNSNYDCGVVLGGTVATCYPTCTVAADCAAPSPAYDADNWSCDQGRCTYLGCNSSDECQQSLMNAAYVCE